jgi:dipeptidyl aminopeptidase/acylaminoacyl peptidase
MKFIFSWILVAGFTFQVVAQNNEVLTVSGNLTVEGIPPLQASIVNDVQPYTESRSASFQSWHATERKMLISTRFANTAQMHMVAQPLGSRKQLTFFSESPAGATFNPVHGNYFLFTKDVGGNEFTNLFRYDIETGKSIQLTKDIRAQNGGAIFNQQGSLIVYTSTRRNGTDREVFMMDPTQPASDKLLLSLKGGGWRVADWSYDGNILLLSQYISVNESNIWLYNLSTKELKQWLPPNKQRSVYQPLQMSKDGTAFYMLTNAEGEFKKPVRVDIQTGNQTMLVSDISWEIENYVLNKNQTLAAFNVNEGGVKKIYVQDLKSMKYTPVSGLPVGIVGSPEWHANGKSFAFNFTSSFASADVYEWNHELKELYRWTESELGGMNLNGLPAPKLIKWKSFDGLEISGFLYEAHPRFTGRRPVIINIHGGPEGQSLPTFLGRLNYYLNELGISIIFPNVRGSVGYGKTFTDRDNGFKREESVKDIGSLLDWIAQWPSLDADRVMVTGGSYGGYMTLATAFHYNDRIRCALDVVGISHFKTFLQNTEDYRRDLRRVEYGDERDPKMAAFFEKIAPLNNAHKIKKPMFIVQGKNDPRVPSTEARQMVDKIKANGGTVWYLEADDEGHGFRKKSNQDYQFYATIEFIKRFLIN